MVQLQAGLEEFEAANLQIIAISYDSVDTLKGFSDAKSITYPLLSDEGSAVIRLLGLENKKGLPHPGTLIVDQAGIVRGKVFNKGYVKRHSNQDLLDLAAELKLGIDQPSSDKKGSDGSGSKSKDE